MCDHEPPGERQCRCKIERVPNFTQPRLLLALAKKPSYGYELIEQLGQGENSPPDPGNFYRMLRTLEEDQLVCSTWDTENSGPARRVYELTDQGVEFLHAWAVTIHQIQQSLEKFLSGYRTLFPK